MGTRRPVEVRRGTGPSPYLQLAALLTGMAVLAAVWAAAAAGAALTGRPGPGSPAGFAVYPVLLATGKATWPGPAATAVLTGELAAVALAGLLALRRRHPTRTSRSRVDDAARQMAAGAELGSLTPAQARAEAARLRPGGAGADSGGHGVLLGATLRGVALRSSYEEVSVDVWGPRKGKTTRRTIPAVVEAPGAVVATSNKRDLLDGTRDVRAAVGEVFVFDMQGLTGSPASWWFNPLSTVRTVTDAEALAAIFRAAETDPGAKRDAYFDAAADKLLSLLLLAAAHAGESLGTVSRWVHNPRNDTPEKLLREHGFADLAERVTFQRLLPDKQRLGIYGSTEVLLRSVNDPDRLPWITPDQTRREFVPAEFVTGPHTLYALSQEGKGSTGALVGALVQATLDAAERAAARSPGGRLDPPLLPVLDEAANVCRLPNLPARYSHYGSRGIPIMTSLQSYRQGENVWGREGMAQLWDSANIRVYGGGVADRGWLEDLSALVGDKDVLTHSATRGDGRRSVSEQRHTERILPVDELAALPTGRAVLYASGRRPALIQTLPWWEGPHRAGIAASFAAHDPAGQVRVDDPDPDHDDEGGVEERDGGPTSAASPGLEGRDWRHDTIELEPIRRAGR